MSHEIVERTRELAETTALEAVWSQWTALTSLAVDSARPPAWTVVDPEALVLASLLLSPLEPRLEDQVAAWAREAGFLMSKPRFRGVVALFPEEVESRVADFARYATQGGDSRWRSWVSSESSEHSPREKSLGPLHLTSGPALVLRLRAAFGVTAKADILAMLLGLDGTAMGLKAIASSLGYSERMIRTATEEMALAGFIVEVEGRPSSFYVDAEPWASVLRPYFREVPDGEPWVPPWRSWGPVLAFLCDVSRWAVEARSSDWPDYVTSSLARDLFDRHQPRLQQVGIRLPAPLPAGQTDRWLETFRQTVERVRSWGLGR